MEEELTPKQRQVLEAVREFQNRNGYPPTVRELAEWFGLSSPASVHKILQVLKDKGYLRKDERKSRSLGLVDDDSMVRRVRPFPLLGKVEAGMPQLAYEDKEAELYLDLDWAGKENLFLLRVHGHSMIDADIRDGDILVVEQTQSCRNGDIIIALLDDEATVKRFFREKDRIRLQPENQAMQPIYIPRDDPNFAVIGIVRGLLRKF